MVIKIKVIPNAPKDKIGDRMGEFTKVYITAPPVDNKANLHLVSFLSGQYKVSRSRIRIIRGEKSPYKTVEVSGM
ncbi:MAG: DUF167 domain-containing protein [bacterium]|nr:DUF167 domain-containing protein [bacterium]